MIYNKQDLLQHVQSFQRCQRNWDLNKTIDSDTIKHLHDIALSTPTKQNIVNFDIIVVKNRDVINKVAEVARNHDQEKTFKHSNKMITQLKAGRLQNPQVDCNLLFLYFRKDYNHQVLIQRCIQAVEMQTKQYIDISSMEMGISAGALGLAAHQIGLKTGFCQCVMKEKLPDILFKDNNINKLNFSLALSIGYPLHENHTWHNNKMWIPNSSKEKTEYNKIVIE